MLNTCFLLLVIGQVIFGQQNSITDNLFGGRNSSLLKKFEIVTKAPLQSLGAFVNCGEGADRGVHRCVPYYDCDPINNIINELEAPQNGSGLIDIRAGSNSCEHYLDVCCRITQTPVSTTQRTTTLPSPSSSPKQTRRLINLRPQTTLVNTTRTSTLPPRKATSRPNTKAVNVRPCGIRNAQGIDFRITGNTNDEAEYGEFPWIVALLEQNVNQTGRFSFCGGSLITPNVILTAAHCVEKYSSNDIKIRAGEWDAQTEKERLPHQERNVSQILIHEDFANDVLYNDIALLVLTNPVELMDNVDTICLPTQNQDVQLGNCFAGGWGKDAFGSEGQYQMILKKVELPLVARTKCLDALRTTRLGRRFILHESFRCAGGEEGKDTCKGDGGSPLVCPIQSSLGDERYIQTGIVAWGISCGNKDIPGVYTDVTKYRKWIDTQLDQLKIDQSAYTF